MKGRHDVNVRVNNERIPERRMKYLNGRRDLGNPRVRCQVETDFKASFE